LTLSHISSDCETCGTRSLFTGRTQVEGGRRYAMLRCPDCHAEFPVWQQKQAALVEAYVAARERLTNPVAYDRAWAILLGGDATAIAVVLARPPAELPLFSLRDVRLPASSADRWVDLILDWRGWRPEPEPADRLEEALDAAIHFDSTTCAASVATRVGQWPPPVFVTALDRLRRRGKLGAPVLLPVLASLRERGGEWAASVE
jgi:hypothetical protein